MIVVDAPLPFPGTEEEARANYWTHSFGHENRCLFCDCNSWGTTKDYPCGVEPPRGLLANGRPITEEEYLELLATQEFNDAEREDH